MLFGSIDSASLNVELPGDDGSHTLEDVCPLRTTLEVVGGCIPTNEAPCVGGFIGLHPMFVPLSGSLLAPQYPWRQVRPLSPWIFSNGEGSISRGYVECF